MELTFTPNRVRVKKNFDSEAPSIVSAFPTFKHCSFNLTDSLLELDCGAGHFSAQLADKVPMGQVRGVDPNETLIEQARKTYRQIDGLEFSAVASTHITFHQQFDLVTSLTGLNRYKDKLKVFAGIKKALKQSGKAFIVSYPKDLHWDLLQLHCQSPSWKARFEGYEPPIYHSDILRHNQLFELVGLKVESSSIVPGSYVFKSKDEYEEFLRLWLPHLKQLSSVHQADFINSLVRLIRNRLNFVAGAPIVLPYCRVETWVSPIN